MTATLTNVPEVRPVGRPRSTEERPSLHVVDSTRRRPAGLIGAVAVLVVFGALFANAVAHSVLVSGQSRLDLLNQRVSQQQTANEHLRLDVARLESPDRIVQAATKAGMIVPSETHWVTRQADGAAVSSTSSRATPPPSTDSSSATPNERAAGANPTTPTTVPQGR